MTKRTLSLSLLLSILTTIVRSAPGGSASAFVGKWKLDPAHSRLTDQMRVESAGSNKYKLNFSGDNIETIVADGSDQPALFGTTLAIVVQDTSNWKVVRKTNGRLTIIGLWKLSPDGNELTDNFTGYHENGTTTNLRYIYHRIDGEAGNSRTPGFVGTWESTTEDVSSSYEIKVETFRNDGLSFINSAAQITQSLRFDGKDYPGSGANAPSGYSSSGKRINDHVIQRVDKVSGKTLYTQEMELSSDHRVLTMTIHVPGRDKPNIMVFNRE